MLTRALLLFGLIAGVSVGAILTTVHLPEIALLRYAVLAAPLIGALVVVIGWLDSDACGAVRTTWAPHPAPLPADARMVHRGRSPQDKPSEPGAAYSDNRTPGDS
jgi:hypothetical protein